IDYRPGQLSQPRLKQMATFELLGVQVSLSKDSAGDLARDAFQYFNSRPHKRCDLVRIIGEQPNLPDAQKLQNLGGQLVIAVVRLEAEALIGLNGVQTLVLKLISPQLRHEADAAPFLLFVHEDTGSLLGN